jgi:short-subunit dehydrogenase
VTDGYEEVDMFTITGAVAVVTGASSGLGRRMAVDLAASGSVVTGIARREDRLRTLAAAMTPSSPASSWVACDVSDTERYSGVLRDVESAHGRIDLLINDAGIGEPDTEGLEKYRTVMATNFFGAVAGTLAVLPGMMRRRHGAIVNVSSDTARAPGPGEPAYAASKAALSAFTESLSFEAERHGVHLHVLYPGFVPTEMTEGTEVSRIPRFVRRTEEAVSRAVLEGIGKRRVEIDATRVARLAPVARTFFPGMYRRGVRAASPE